MLPSTKKGDCNDTHNGPPPKAAGTRPRCCNGPPPMAAGPRPRCCNGPPQETAGTRPRCCRDPPQVAAETNPRTYGPKQIKLEVVAVNKNEGPKTIQIRREQRHKTIGDHKTRPTVPAAMQRFIIWPPIDFVGIGSSLSARLWALIFSWLLPLHVLVALAPIYAVMVQESLSREVP